MASNHSDDERDAAIAPVGPFTGFGNFFFKELRDWWNSWRLIIIFAITTLIITLEVFFAYEDRLRMADFIEQRNGARPSNAVIATAVLLDLFRSPILFIFIIIFSTMGILATEKSTGTLAWNLTKPLGRTGLLVAKWLAATAIIWLGMCVLPVLLASLCMIGYHGVTPLFAKMAPIVGASFVWIGFWVLLVLTVSLFFQSQAAVGGVTIAFWIVPTLFGVLMGEVLGKENRDWVLDRFAPNAPFWSFLIVADKDLIMFGRDEWKNVWLWSFAIWTAALSILSLRIFNRQEIGS